jgi:hypothetical protein
MKFKVIKQFLMPKLANVPLPAFIEKFLTTARVEAGQAPNNSIEGDKTVTSHGPV